MFNGIFDGIFNGIFEPFKTIAYLKYNNGIFNSIFNGIFKICDILLDIIVGFIYSDIQCGIWWDIQKNAYLMG